MDVFPTPEQRLLAETAADFVARRVPRERVREIEASELGFDRDDWAAMAALGWTDLAPLELALVVEELGRGAVPSPLVVTAALRNALPRLAVRAAPDAVATLAAVVPGAVDERTGPHPGAAPTLHATYLLVPYASAAEHVVGATAAGLAVFPATAGGVTLRRHDAIGGDALFRIDARAVDAEPLDGSLEAVLAHLGVTALAYAVGAAESALASSVDHARSREQFGTPIGAFQAVAHRCADMRADVDACRVLAHRAAWALDARAPDLDRAVAAALAYGKDALRRVAMHAHQVHGAIGFSTEHDLHLFTRRVKAFELTAGAAASHHDRLASAIGLVP